jgi:hypothetical protein
LHYFDLMQVKFMALILNPLLHEDKIYRVQGSYFNDIINHT